jgi:hypothetical protein
LQSGGTNERRQAFGDFGCHGEEWRGATGL